MDWELLMRMKSLFVSTGVAALVGLLIVIAILLAAAVKERSTGG